MQVSCIQCNQSFRIIPSRAGKAKFCSYECRGKWRSVHAVGANNPNWKGGERKPKACQHCGAKIEQGSLPLTTFRQRKFCSKACADVGGFRYSGEHHPNWTGGTRKRPKMHDDWAKRVISRDKAMCRTCGATGVELHAHHVKPYKDNPDLRWQLSNGITLCAPCHWAVHSASNANAVNSGNPQHEQGGGNPEPSQSRKVLEGVTTRGRAYRRIDGHCGWCGSFLSRRASDALNRPAIYCNKSCMMKHRQAQWKAAKRTGQ